MKLNNLPKTTTKRKKRVGRGYGSGKGGHTTNRGQKGQKARYKVGLLFEGTKMRKSLIRRLPMLRGKDKNKSYKDKPIAINVKYLNLLKDGSKVNVEALVKNNIVVKDAKEVGVKILGDGKLEKKLTVEVPVSKGAREKIEKAGGKVVKPRKKKTVKPPTRKASEVREKKKQTSKKKVVKKRTVKPPTRKATKAKGKK
jgi:large subunit ribosomal protein L15